MTANRTDNAWTLNGLIRKGMMKRRGRTRILIPTVVSALLASAITISSPATPAWADENDGWCTDRELCIFEHWYAGGGRRDYFNGDLNYTNDTFWYWGGGPGPAPSNAIVNDRASSASNGDSQCKALLHEHADFAGSALLIWYRSGSSGLMVNDLGQYGMNDTISSNSWTDCI
ncbi:hypothetical protein [Nonomuraea jiangxiensis]|uniref:Peptidase inhibitor family I36 n=1 Tax=Nonomuraea jiangxiensis TaxID=633440 RepID=A0A1G9WF02_9ACTN|nr:hypothetical protein [Nonomuraea jiangxiensis]SDM82791.1 hypothetical protein SAMN05421869_15825 [Nonomuraea jiangxiensis]